MMDATITAGSESAMKLRRSQGGKARGNRFAERDLHSNLKRGLTYQDLEGENQELRFLSQAFHGTTANWEKNGIPDRYFFDDSAGTRGDIYLLVWGADSTSFVMSSLLGSSAY